MGLVNDPNDGPHAESEQNEQSTEHEDIDDELPFDGGDDDDGEDEYDDEEGDEPEYEEGLLGEDDED